MTISPSQITIPPSTVTVEVSIIYTSTIYPSTSIVLTPHVSGHDTLSCPCYAFLITHGEERVFFDLGLRPDVENLSPVGQGYTRSIRVEGKNDVVDVIGDMKIDALIWSHHHFDHIGDISRFPPETEVVVGPGIKKEYFPAYPTNPDSWLLESDYQGRTVHELEFRSGEALNIGGYDAIDYFKDGSFYLLDCPGHTVGHICALVRTTPNSFILLGGDCCHHAGQFRPSQSCPLPDQTIPTLRKHASPCPGSIFQLIHPKKSSNSPFYELKEVGTHDMVAANESRAKLMDFDASDDVLVLIAHDNDIKDIVDFYPGTLNEWKAKGWKEKLKWAFLDEFKVDS